MKDDSGSLAPLEAELGRYSRGSDRWYQDTVESAGIGTWSWDLVTGDLIWSPQCKALFGFSADTNITYDLFLTALYPEDRESVDAAVRQAIESRADYDKIGRVVLPGGAIAWRRFKGSIFTDHDSGVRLFQGIVIDVNAQKVVEAKLRETESQAQRVLDSMAEGFAGLDSEFRFTYVNTACEEILGKKREDLIGRNIWEVFPEGIGTDIENNYRKAMAERCTLEFISHFDPWSRWFSIKVYPAEDGITVFLREITRQKQMEVALLDTQERFEMINNFIPVMVWTTRPEGNFDYFNRRWVEYTGKSVEECTGSGWTQMLHPDDAERTIARWQHSLETGEPYEMESRLQRGSDGSWHWFLGQAVPVKGRNGKIVRWFGTWAEIDDRKRVEGELAASRKNAEEASQAKSQFLASMSHELRTPLNAIIGYSEMLQEEVEELGVAQLGPDIAKIHTAGKHLLALISDILDLSKIEAGKMDVFAEEFDIADAVNEVTATVEPLIRKKNNQLEVKVDPGIGKMFSDLTKIRQSLFNLLSNSSKFTKDGVITLSAKGDDRFVTFQVSDTGMGIAPEKIGDLFEPFSQVHGSSVKAGGTGLGLAITKRFCEMLGGDIYVDSTEGKGATFTLKLLRRMPAASGPAVVATQGTSRDHHAGRGVVLVIDDDATARDLMSRYLVREGYKPVLASSGEEGIRLAHEIHPNVITLDVIMPGMDGWAVLQALKSDPGLACIPVVMVTMLGDKSLGFALGAADFVMKPVTREKLASIVSRFRCANPPCRVLVVEDDDASRELATSIFEKEGWLVTQAANGVEALDAISEAKPALIVLDLMMPKMDGFEFTAQLRRREDGRHIPIVVLTGKDITAEDRERLKGNVEKFLSKGSLSNDQMLSEVREILNTCTETNP